MGQSSTTSNSLGKTARVLAERNSNTNIVWVPVSPSCRTKIVTVPTVERHHMAAWKIQGAWRRHFEEQYARSMLLFLTSPSPIPEPSPSRQSSIPLNPDGPFSRASSSRVLPGLPQKNWSLWSGGKPRVSSMAHAASPEQASISPAAGGTALASPSLLDSRPIHSSLSPALPQNIRSQTIGLGDTMFDLLPNMAVKTAEERNCDTQKMTLEEKAAVAEARALLAEAAQQRERDQRRAAQGMATTAIERAMAAEEALQQAEARARFLENRMKALEEEVRGANQRSQAAEVRAEVAEVRAKFRASTMARIDSLASA